MQVTNKVPTKNSLAILGILHSTSLLDARAAIGDEQTCVTRRVMKTSVPPVIVDDATATVDGTATVDAEDDARDDWPRATSSQGGDNFDAWTRWIYSRVAHHVFIDCDSPRRASRLGETDSRVALSVIEVRIEKHRSLRCRGARFDSPLRVLY